MYFILDCEVIKTYTRSDSVVRDKEPSVPTDRL